MNKEVNVFDEEIMDEEFTQDEVDRIDEVYDAVLEMCRVLCEDPELESDMEFVGEIADYAARVLTDYGKRVRFPFRTETDDGKTCIKAYYE